MTKLREELHAFLGKHLSHTDSEIHTKLMQARSMLSGGHFMVITCQFTWLC
jgi:hypothetical protein